MDRVAIDFFQSDRALADAVAERWLQSIAEAAAQNRRQHVALSGGRIARHFFSAVAAQSKRRNLSLSGVEFFWADERCVPPNHADSNYALAEEFLFRPADIGAPQIHRLRGEIDPTEAAREAEAELKRLVHTDPHGFPVLDLVFLGMGEDGHVASLFPGAPATVAASTRCFEAVTAAKPPPHRITMTYPVLAAAREVWVLVSGAGKEGALTAALHEPDSPTTPLGRVLQSRRMTKLFTDLSEKELARHVR